MSIIKFYQNGIQLTSRKNSAFLTFTLRKPFFPKPYVVMFHSFTSNIFFIISSSSFFDGPLNSPTGPCLNFALGSPASFTACIIPHSQTPYLWLYHCLTLNERRPRAYQKRFLRLNRMRSFHNRKPGKFRTRAHNFIRPPLQKRHSERCLL